MPEQMVSIGFQIPGGEIDNINFNEKSSLLDYDIILCSTGIENYIHFGYDTYNGKSSLSDDASFNLKESFNHWKNQIKDAYENGKAVIVYLDELKEFYIATGERTYSGTGRNRQTTRIVSLTNTYNFLPYNINPIGSIGKNMILNSKFQFLKYYWEVFQNQSTYSVIFEEKNITPLIETKSGKKIVGGIISNKETNGFILFLPTLNFSDKTFIQSRGEKNYWSPKGKEFGHSLVAGIISIYKSFKSESGKTPIPEWVNSDEFLISEEIDIRNIMIEKEKEISNLQEELSQNKEVLNQIVSIKDLLFEQGKSLERAIMKALDYLGFQTSQYKENDSEFDVVFECSEGRFLGEAEGKDNKAINIDKLRQLEMNINEDFSRENIHTIAKGVLFGNPFRLQPIINRNDSFTEKCQIAARRSGIALITTADLFLLCQNVKQDDEETKKLTRERILNSVGIANFNDIIKKD